MTSSTQHDRRRRGPRGRGLTGRQVNLLLGVLVVGAVLTGLAGFALPDGINGVAVTAHTVVGVLVALLVPAKVRGPVRAGLARGRASRWVSVGFGIVVLVALALGVVHATGLWHGVGPWSPLWTHTLLGFVALGLLAWHVATRPVRPTPRDLSRRALLRTGALGLGAGVLVAGQAALVHVLRLDGARRRHTGSYEVASGDPTRLPPVIWLTDRVPADTAAASWDLRVQGRRVAVEELWSRARPTRAVLDCTGGWWSEQTWDAVPLAALVATPIGRSVLVRSVTGHARRFGLDELSRVHLAVGYDGEPLAAHHGAPVRVVAPGRRGPWWVKWVGTIADDPRPPWAELPLPLS